MQFFPEDWINGTRFLSQEEKGVYIDMIAMSWDKPIPKKRLPFLINTTWENLSPYIKEKFIDDGETVINIRVQKDIATYNEYREKQKLNGKKGGRPRTQKKHSNSNSNSKPKSNSKIPTELEFLDYGCTIIKQLNKNPDDYVFSIKAKYHSWKDDEWKNAFGKKIINWKNTLNNTIPHLKPIKNGQSKNNEHEKYRSELLDKIQSKESNTKY